MKNEEVGGNGKREEEGRKCMAMDNECELYLHLNCEGDPFSMKY